MPSLGNRRSSLPTLSVLVSRSMAFANAGNLVILNDDGDSSNVALFRRFFSASVRSSSVSDILVVLRSVTLAHPQSPFPYLSEGRIAHSSRR